MNWHADEAGALLAYAAVATGGFTRFAAIAAALGSVNIPALDSMVQAALSWKRRDVAEQVLMAADQPGPHQDLVRQRLAELRSL
ncbi:MAG: hypothetical protein JWN52_4679 [Actinomycetia bacterium]|nr:hypothetical protein [Actinomycetes bacterium]